jgi:photosystem II stability/assembly factor-like uncharacterized protein
MPIIIKKKAMKKVLSILLLMLLLVKHPMQAQINAPDELKQKLQGKTKFYDIKNEVENYYKQEQSKLAATDAGRQRNINRQLKFWNRYFYWAEMHQGKNGEVIKNMPARLFNAVNVQPNAAMRSAFGIWSFVGPSYAPDGVGRVNRLAFHPTNANIIYAGTANGGLWRLTWIGSTYSWVCLTNYIPELSISGIVVSHANPDIIYILTGDGDEQGGFVNQWGYRGNSIGVLKTTDGGSNWFATAPFPELINSSYRGYSLIQDPNNANTLLAATTRGIYKTTNGGNSWLRSTMTGTDDDRPAFDIEFKPGSSSTVYGVCQKTNGSADFFKSENGGNSFLIKTLGINGVNRAAITVTPANPNYVYALCGPGNIVNGNASNNTFKGFFWSSNSGESFSPQATAPDILGNITPTLILEHQSGYDLAVAASRSNASIIMTGGLIVCKSENRGLDFDEMTDYFPSDPDDDDCIHPDVHDLAYNPVDGRLYAASDGGVSVSSDNGDNFTTLFDGLQIAQFYHFEPSNEDGLVWGGTQDCGVLLQNSGDNFELYRGGDGYNVLTDKTGNNDDSYDVVNNHIKDDSPDGFNDITPTSETEFFPLIAMHPTNEDILYAGYTNRLYISKERGDNWKNRGSITSKPTSARWAIGICPSNGNRIYCSGFQNASVNGLWRIDAVTDDANFTVTRLFNIDDAGYTFGSKITAIAVNPANSSNLWISIASDSGEAKILFSDDAGDTWQNKTGSLPTAVPATAIITDAAGNTYVGTDIGVYYRSASMNDWTAFYNGLPRVAISELKFLTEFNSADPPNPLRYIYASTFGRGIWRSEIFENCTGTLDITQTLRGQKFYQAGVSINSSSVITGGIGTNVNFQSGNSITLTTDFESTPGIVFRGYLRNCNTGTLPDARASINADSLQKLKEPLPGILQAVTVLNTAKIAVVKIHKEGNYSLQLFSENHEPLKTLASEKMYGKGTTELNLTKASVPKGFYHIVLMKGDKELNFQEWEVK